MMMRNLILAAALAAIAAPAFAQGDAPAGGPSGPSTAPLTGEQLYHQTCAACHMHDAKGATGAATIPSLAANPRLGAAAYPITIVSTGKGAMPSFAAYLTKAQIASVITYVRTNFGNSYAKPVTEDDVAKIWKAYGH